MQSTSKAGGISHIGYNILKRLVLLKLTGKILVSSITDLANGVANSRLKFLYHWLATRTIPVRKKDGSARPIGIGDVIRRVVLKVIDRQHSERVKENCIYQMGNGQILGCEGIIHSLREVSKDMKESGKCILALDAFNAFNSVKRGLALEVIHRKVPEMHYTSINVYGKPSYSIIHDEIISMEEGVAQGCPLASSFFNLGISPMIEKLDDTTSGTQSWYMDDGFFIGTPEEVKLFWQSVSTIGPSYGYRPNNKSIVWDLNSGNNSLWDLLALQHTTEGLEVLGCPIGSDSFVERIATKKFEGLANIIYTLDSIGKLHPQHAFIMFLKSTKSKVTYVNRTVPNSWKYSTAYDISLQRLMSTLFGCPLSNLPLDQIAAPIREGSLGINVETKGY